MTPTDIEERISDILSDIDDLATDSGKSIGEIFLEVGLAMLLECTGRDLPAEERAKATADFLQALQQKAEVSA